MNAVVDALIRASIQGALFIAAVWLVCRLIPRLPASVRCGLWWAACLKLLLGLVWVTPLELPLLPADPSPLAPLPSHSPRPGEGNAMAAASLSPSSPGEGMSGKQETGTTAQPGSPLPVGGSAVGEGPGVREPGGGEPRWAGAGLLAALWLTILLIFALQAVRQLRHTRRVIREANPLRDGWIRTAFLDLCERLGLRRAPELRGSAEVRTPQVTGLARPVLLLPEAGLARLSPAEISMTLCHELVHLRRRDLWLGWVPALAQRIFFFHPLAALAAREYVIAREAACDAEVLRVLGSAPQAYGRLLLRWGVAPRETGLAAAGASPSLQNLKRRLQMLQQISNNKRRLSGWWWVAGAAALVALIPIRIVAQEPEAVEAVAAVDAVEAVEAVEPVAPVAVAEVAEPAKPVEPADPVAPVPPVPVVAPVSPVAPVEGIPEGVEGGIPGGVEGGIAGGIEGGVPGGVRGGIPGGVRGGVPGGVAGGVRGVLAVPPPPPSPSAVPLPAPAPRPAPPVPSPKARPALAPLPLPPAPGALPAVNLRPVLASAPPAPPAHLASSAPPKGPGPKGAPPVGRGPVGAGPVKEPPTPPAPPKPPKPPAPPKKSGYHYGYHGNGDSYVLLHDDDSAMMSGSLSEIDRVKKLRGSSKEDILWFRHNGREYVIRDPATLRRAKEIFRPQMELGAKQGELGGRQGELGGKQGALGAKQGALGAEMAALATSRIGSRDDDEDLAARQEKLAREMEELGRQQEALGRQQEELGRKQEALGRQQEEAARKAQKEFRELTDQAIRSGAAQEVGR